MALFGKNMCSVCGNEKGKNKFLDGEVCSTCIKKAASFFPYKLAYKNISVSEIVKDIEKSNYKSIENMDKLTRFKSVRKIDKYLDIDINNRWWIPFPSESGLLYVYSADEIISFELIEDGQLMQKGRKGPTNKKIDEVANVGVNIILDNILLPSIFMRTLKVKTKSGSLSHRMAISEAQSIIAALEVLTAFNKSNSNQTNGISSADEIKSFKELLDKGIITQAEFDGKKKQLLGL